MQTDLMLRLPRTQNMVDRKVARGIIEAQRKPLTPSVGQITNTVGSAYGISASEVLDRNHEEGHWLAGYLLRRVGNLPLGDVARRVGEIQTRIEHGKTSRKMQAVLQRYKVKD